VEVRPGLRRLDTPMGSRTNSLYLFWDADAALLFDTGVDGTYRKHLLPYLRANALDPHHIRWIVVSHADVDHFGGLAEILEQLPWATSIAHTRDAPLIECWATYERERAREFRDP